MQLEGGVHPTEVSFMIYLTAVFLASYMFNKRDLLKCTCMLNSIQNVKFIKNAKAHSVYHCSLCFIFDQTTLAQEQKSL